MTALTTDEALLKAMHSSLCIRWGTTAPYAIGHVRAERVGFASIPMVAVAVSCRHQDIPALVPVVRQRVYGELAERGWSPDDIEFSPSVGGSYRQRMFVDENESSESVGRRKRGVNVVFHWEMHPALARATFTKFGSFANLPDKTAAKEER